MLGPWVRKWGLVCLGPGTASRGDFSPSVYLPSVLCSSCLQGDFGKDIVWLPPPPLMAVTLNETQGPLEARGV